MTTIVIKTELDVLDKYCQLVKASLDSESAYIRAKETVEDLFKDGTINHNDKAQIISSIIGGLTNSITTGSMSAAIQWATAERELEFKKLELAKQLDAMDQDIAVKAAQQEQVETANRLAKVESRRMYGVGTFDAEGNLTGLDNSGKVAIDMELTQAQKSKVAEEERLTAQKTKESYAAVHKIVADTYVNYGNYTFTEPTMTGISSVTQKHPTTFKTLSDTQQEIAIEQAKGYTYNAWANALTGSSSMLGTLLAAESATFEVGDTGYVLLKTILDTAKNLQNADSTLTEAIPANRTNEQVTNP